jgi:hypothetical protein
MRTQIASWRPGSFLPVMIRSIGAGLFVWAVYAISGQSGTGILAVEIRDKATGAVTPAMVCITSFADGKWRTPPDGTIVPPYSTTREFYTPPDWKPGDIGPVRLTNGDYKDNDTRSVIYEGHAAYPFWQEPAAYFVSKPFTIKLPAGKWRLAVARGIETMPVVEEFQVAPNQSLDRRIGLERWVDMARLGWYSGDDHVHYPRLKPEHDQFLMTWTRAEDVHVANILRMGDVERIYFEQGAYGKESRFQQGDAVLVTGQEDPRTGIDDQGHAIALNITAPVRDTSQYHLYDLMFDRVHKQGGLTGYAHIAWTSDWNRRSHPDSFPTWDPEINVPRGKVDFFEILQFLRLGLEDYYDFLSLGYRLTASAGSDVPWGATIGETRVYAYTGANFSANSWFSAVKQGRTFVTNGPMLTLAVDDSMPGDERNVRQNSTLGIRARAWAPSAIGSPKMLEIVANGRVVRTAMARDPNDGELQLDIRMRAASSEWIAARVTAQNGALAHTSPVYVRVAGAPVRDDVSLPQLVEKRLKALDFIAARLRSGYASGEAKALTKRIGEARTKYQQLAAGR